MLASAASGVAVGLPSDNTAVGYKANELQFGLTFLTPCFIDVGMTDEGADLTKLTPGGGYTSGAITISKLDYAGRDIANYTYSRDRNNVWAWRGDDGAVSEGDVVIEPGEGVSADAVDGLTITSAGAVSTADRTVNLQFGLTFTGNMTATALDLTEIVPGGKYNSGEITISKLDYAGRDIANYTFSRDRNNTWAWRDDDGAVSEGDVVFQPGEGFSVDANDGLTITIPGPTL